MMLKKLTTVAPKIGSTDILRATFFGMLCVLMVSCAQPDQKKQASKGRAASPNNGGAPQNPAERPTGTGSATKPGFISINDAHGADSEIKKYSDSIYIIETTVALPQGESSSSRAMTKSTGFLSERKAITTALSNIILVVAEKLGGVESLKNMQLTEIENKLKETDFTETDLLIKNRSGETINNNMKLKISTGSASRIARILKSGTLTVSLIDNNVRLIADRDLEGEIIVAASADQNFCVEETTSVENASGRNGTQVTPRTSGAQRRAAPPVETTQTAARTASAARQLTLAGFPIGNESSTAATDVLMSSGTLLNLVSALRAVGVQDSITTSDRQVQCSVAALAADSNESSIGGPIFEEGKLVGIVVKLAGTGTAKRTFGLAIKNVE